MKLSLLIVISGLPLLALLSSCSKRQEFESFTIRGVVTDCHTGAPVPNVQVDVLSIDRFNNTWHNYYDYPSGSAMTNALGEYIITPELHSDANQFQVKATADYNHYFEGGTFFERDSIKTSIVEGNFRITRKGWLVVTFSDIINPDTSDWFERYEVSWTDNCALSSLSKPYTYTPLDPSYTAWRGIIINGRAWSDVPGNDTVNIRFAKWSGKQNPTYFYRSIYCPAGDSAYLHVEY